MPDKPPVLAPCPFCGGEAHFERTGTPRQSCIVACTECGARLETGETWEHSGKAWNRRAEVHRDSVDGADRKPDRYAGAEGRETIDAMRDMALAAAEGLGATDPDRVRRLADLLFAYHCDATALKYRQRTGKKGPAADDVRKAEWYEAMARHVRGQGPDPRHKRPGFEPYAYPEIAEPVPPPPPRLTVDACWVDLGEGCMAIFQRGRRVDGTTVRQENIEAATRVAAESGFLAE